MNDLRLELRTRNNRLWHLIFDHYANVADFCRQHGNMNQSEVGRWLNLKDSPYNGDDLKPLAARIVEVSGMSAYELFPLDLYSDLFPITAVAEVESARFRQLAAARHLAIEAPTPEESMIETDAKAKIADALDTLKPREATAIRLRYGLEDGIEWTFSDIASSGKLGRTLTTERVRQIIMRALRKLRLPSRSRRLAAVNDVGSYASKYPSGWQQGSDE